ncbi:hypothetical protein GOP47_0025429 [Adiantum capillus-veneris]|uniref:Beta-carotene isomerase D27-like C-terminal domain-containing protein n=1 Tax=Adiantum capillus-veneris TaxID=13818 RepID=A0A9D4Z2Y7_ADICA|nr:hypothetical protein GOP47_0025429 [Adiantum capillus-veneris]
MAGGVYLSVLGCETRAGGLSVLGCETRAGGHELALVMFTVQGGNNDWDTSANRFVLLALLPMEVAMTTPFYKQATIKPLSRRPLSTSNRAQLVKVKPPAHQSTYSLTPLDTIFLQLFRNKMAQEAGWDSSKLGYDGLIEIANHLFKKSKDRTDAEVSSVRILRSLFPPLLLPMFKILIAPLFGGKPAAVLTARVTKATCQWLMGSCSINTVELNDGTLLESGVLVERCKYLEESKCAGICIHTCKLPSQTFITDYMGVPLTMEPNFEDLSCQFKFGVAPPARQDDESLKTPCLDVCPMASIRQGTSKVQDSERCPQVA